MKRKCKNLVAIVNNIFYKKKTLKLQAKNWRKLMKCSYDSWNNVINFDLMTTVKYDREIL